MSGEDGLTANNKATEQNRTADLLITNQLLYQLSYGGLMISATAETATSIVDKYTPPKQIIKDFSSDFPHLNLPEPPRPSPVTFYMAPLVPNQTPPTGHPRLHRGSPA